VSPEPISANPRITEPHAAGAARSRVPRGRAMSPDPHAAGAACSRRQEPRTAKASWRRVPARPEPPTVPGELVGSAIALRAWPVESQRRPTRRLGRQRAIPASQVANARQRPRAARQAAPRTARAEPSGLAPERPEAHAGIPHRPNGQRPSASSRGPPAAGKACRRLRRQTDSANARQRAARVSKPWAASRAKSTKLSNGYTY
jgi:hypothetical protein